MKKAIIVFVILVMFLFLVGCVQQQAKESLCKLPYIEYKQGDCCLDKNNNSICDKDESLQSQNSQSNVTVKDLDNAPKTDAIQTPLPQTTSAEVSKTDTIQPPLQQTMPTEVPKTDKPVIELFVMSHCPFGNQIEKGIIPVVELLGNKIDFKVKFVYYAMHGEKEVDEELQQYCIQTEQNDKYLTYLSCFLKAGDGQTCLTDAKVDATKLATCVKATDEKFSVKKNFADQSTWLNGRFPKVDMFKADNEKYSVGGSPTLIINGVESSSGRDSESLLKTVCGEFTTAPTECQQTLSSEQPLPGLG